MAVYKEGPLSKWTNVMKGWQYRWFVLDDNTGLLSYYTSKEKMMRGSRRGCVRLKDAIIGIDDEDDSTFTITVDQKVFHFQARDYDDRKEWACALEDTILRHSQRQFEFAPSSSLEEFDKKLAEADAYLQLLIENVKGVGSRISTMEDSSHEKQELERIFATAHEMIEAVKKSIIMLQRAKTAVASCTLQHHHAHLKNAPAQQHQPLDATPSQHQFDGLQESSLPDSHTKTNIFSAPADEEDKESKNKEECLTAETELPAVTPVDDAVMKPNVPSKESSLDESVAPHPAHIIPSTSYSSSDDEIDEFFDADEVLSSVDSRNKTFAEEHQEKHAVPVTSVLDDHNTISHAPSTKSDVLAYNHADMYMEEELLNEKEGESVEEHKSVIVHLLSQVKLGMDLTKVVLPTFILERRSLLEMYADFFSHADYFLQIAREETAEQRMIACLRFYLSTFAAGRNSSVAKKPYNPILGETFQCFWDHASLPTYTNNPVMVEDGPVPWSKSNQLSFLAEQVSHHPPISAFYAEHKDQKIQFNGHIWTKSKFLGLSVGVHNIGQGCIRLLEHGEEYIVNFPNGYGRSILTIPWMELGGDCTVTCEKTGYNAIIKFHTKPFYGGKVHRISGEVLQPNVKKPFLTLEGEWNSVIYANYSTGRSECFVDAKKAKILKAVRKVEHQEPKESRRLWDQVTLNLKANNIDEATTAKRSLEDRQRQDAKDRLENGIVYRPKHFHEDDCQNWIYNTPLSERT